MFLFRLLSGNGDAHHNIRINGIIVIKPNTIAPRMQFKDKAASENDTAVEVSIAIVIIDFNYSPA